MHIIDLKDIFNDNSKLVAQVDNVIYIYKGIDISEEICAMDIYSYDITNKELDRLSKQSIVTNSVYNSVEKFDDCLLIRSIFNNQLTINRLDLESLEVTHYYSHDMNYDQYMNSVFLSEGYLLYYMDKSYIETSSYDAKKDLQREYIKGYMIDIYNNNVYEIKDRRLVLGFRDNIIRYNLRDKPYIMFEEAYMDDYEQENHYKMDLDKSEYYCEGYRETINVISLDILVDSIKHGDNCIPFKEIHRTEKTGWTRYMAMDKDNIYYRSKDFRTSVESIYSVDKIHYDEELIKEIYHDTTNKKDIFYDCDNLKIYSIEEIEGKYLLKGLFNADIDIQYDKSKGEFDSIVDNRYLITHYWTEDDLDNYFDYTIIKDLESGDQTHYLGSTINLKSNLYLI